MSTRDPLLSLMEPLASFGIPSGRVCSLSGEVTTETLPYLDLYRLPVEPLSGIEAIRPDAVVECQTGVVLYVIDEQRLLRSKYSSEDRIRSLRRKLASRGSNGFLAILRPGELIVSPVDLTDAECPVFSVEVHAQPSGGFFQALSNGILPGQKSSRTSSDYVFEAMFKLVWSVAERLARFDIQRSDVLSLVGRALFFRFLRDREIVRDKDLAVFLPGAKSVFEAFDSPAHAYATCRWLDQTFNGDLLPLSSMDEEFFITLGQRTGNRLFVHLRAIVKGEEPVGDEGYQLPLPMDFGVFDFAHVPVGLLSQVYERFAWAWERETAKQTSVHYTPRHLAQLMVDEAFDGLAAPDQVRVLDPACGASVFLVLAFRRLYLERWKATGKRPETTEIRTILDTQLVGFDINESAIRLASLSLYLTAIELDPNPVPPEKLQFHHLRDQVLFNFRLQEEESRHGVVIGSLGSHVPKAFDGAFDLVIGNPPWTSLGKNDKNLAAVFQELSQRIIRGRGAEDLARTYRNPDKTPDLPFVWKATEWCKEGGRIVLALPASILLKQEDTPSRAREAMFGLIEVNGIINGTNLSDTKVWEKMNQPFMLLFATNRIPSEGHRLRLITPYLDERLNARGLFRIDSKSTQWIAPKEMEEESWMWKALTVGTALDAQVIRKILGKALPTVSQYWEEQLGLVSGRGYDVEGEPQKDASFLKHKPNLTQIEYGHFTIDTDQLPLFDRETLYFPKTPEIYRAPLFLLKESSPERRECANSLVSFDDLAYSRSFYGYSANGNAVGRELVGYFLLLTHSSIWSHYRLVTSSKLAAERRTVLKSTFDDFPIVPYDSLTADQRTWVGNCSERLLRGDLSVFPEIDALFAELYGLDESDLQVIKDSLATAMPFGTTRHRACNPPTPGEVHAFTVSLQNMLQPFFTIAGEQVSVELVDCGSGGAPYDAPFRFFSICRTKDTVSLPQNALHQAILQLADSGGASRIIVQTQRGLLIGLFNQYRYWTGTRARLLATEIARDHLSVFDV